MQRPIDKRALPHATLTLEGHCQVQTSAWGRRLKKFNCEDPLAMRR